MKPVADTSVMYLTTSAVLVTVGALLLLNAVRMDEDLITQIPSDTSVGRNQALYLDPTSGGGEIHHKQISSREKLQLSLKMSQKLHSYQQNDEKSRYTFDSSQTLRVDVDASRIIANVTHFWSSTGFCPPTPHHADCSWLLSEDMRHNLAYMGAVPHAGIRNVRVHLLLDAVYVTGLRDGSPVYNFTCLDTFLQRLYENGLQPGFELMGNPSGYFSDLENHTQVLQWRELVRQIAQRYIDEYGLGYVSKWNFESWNEPKKRSFDELQFTIQGFLNYYDACSSGLRLASPRLQLGAPSGGCNSDQYVPHKYCWALLNHLDHGMDYFTGRRPRVDYISVHKKGEVPNNTAAIMAKERVFLDLLERHTPTLTGLPLVNDEGDPLVTWSRSLPWRADNTYSSMVVKIIDRHQKTYFSKPNPVKFRLLSNDNGFLSYQPAPFSQRTLLARFQVNSTRPRHTQFVRKPGHSVMGLMALLGDSEVYTHWVDADLSDSVGLLSSVHSPSHKTGQDSWQMAAAAYYSIDTESPRLANTPQNITLEVNITNIPTENIQDMRYVVYSLSSIHGNPYRTWVNTGSPKTPSPKLFDLMREQEDPVRLSPPAPLPPSAVSGQVTVRVELSLPSVALIHVCGRARRPPDQVTNVVVYPVTCNQVMIVWSDSCVNSKCLLRYDVEFSVLSDVTTFKKINPRDSIFTVYVYTASPQVQGSCRKAHGFYRVRAVDYWGRPGEYSPIVHYG